MSKEYLSFKKIYAYIGFSPGYKINLSLYIYDYKEVKVNLKNKNKITYNSFGQI